MFIDTSMRIGTAWLDEIDRQIQTSDFIVMLLSQQSADSEMVQAEVHRAYQYRHKQGKPRYPFVLNTRICCHIRLIPTFLIVSI